MRVVGAAFQFAGVTLVTVWLAMGAHATRAEVLQDLEGDVRSVDATTPFATDPGASLASFVLVAARSEHDLRVDPGSLLILTNTGLLFAQTDASTRRFQGWRRDANSGRPLRADAATGAQCATGAEPDCWRAGDPLPYSGEVAAALGIEPFSVAYPLPAAPSMPIPVVPLNSDPVDRLPDTNTNLGGTLSSAQQALLGCGPVWGTNCDSDGIDLRNADASVLLQSWASVAPPAPTSTPPGTVGTPGTRGPVATRSCTPGNSGYCPTNSGPAPITLPFTGVVFVNELAALSWNLQMLLVAFYEVSDGQPHAASEFDPMDPVGRAPHQCSLAQPQFCASVHAMSSLASLSEPLEGDPGEPAMHWLWEAGAEYRVLGAWGDLEPYAGGSVHVLGIEPSRTPRASRGVPVALFPAAGATLAPSTPFASASSDGMPSDHGFAYLSAPEPGATAIAASALVALAALTRQRRR